MSRIENLNGRSENTLPVQGLLLDVDGVLTTSWRPLPGAVEALARLRAAGLPVALLTNTTTKTRRRLAETLRGLGFEVDAAQVLTAPVATAGYLRRVHAGARVFVLGPPDVAGDLEGVELVDDRADVVVVAGADDAFSYAALNRAFRMLTDGAALVAMHRNLRWMTDDGILLDSGPFVTLLEEAANVTATVVGKPSPDFFGEGLRALGLPAGAVVMVGDDLENDVLAAQEIGLRGVLVRTGKFRACDEASGRGRPWATVDSIADVPDLVARR